MTRPARRRFVKKQSNEAMGYTDSYGQKGAQEHAAVYSSYRLLDDRCLGSIRFTTNANTES